MMFKFDHNPFMSYNKIPNEKISSLLILQFAAQLRQPIENSLDVCHLKTLRLYTGPFKFELDHYLTNVARVKSTYWG